MGINIRIEKIKKWIMENVKDIYTFNDGIYVSEQDALCCIKHFCKL